MDQSEEKGGAADSSFGGGGGGLRRRRSQKNQREIAESSNKTAAPTPSPMKIHFRDELDLLIGGAGAAVGGGSAEVLMFSIEG